MKARWNWRQSLMLVAGLTLLAFGWPETMKAADAKPKPDFWAATFNNAEAFDNLGIESFRHGTLVSRKLHFKGAAETEVGYTIYLPPDYERSNARYPILYVLPGNAVSENATAGTVVKKAHELMQAGKLPPFIIASFPGGSSFYGNQYEGKCQVHDFFFDEFMPFIEGKYRVKTEAPYRHLQGGSAGGNGALMYAFERPELFGTVTAVAGAFDGVRVNYWAPMYGADDNNYRPYDPARLAQQNKARLGGMRIALWCGSEDVTRGDNARMHATLTREKIDHVFNDANSRPKLEGVTHKFPLYYELYGDEILEFHGEAFRR